MSHREIVDDYDQQDEEMDLFMESLQEDDPDVMKVRGWLQQPEERTDISEYNPE